MTINYNRTGNWNHNHQPIIGMLFEMGVNLVKMSRFRFNLDGLIQFLGPNSTNLYYVDGEIYLRLSLTWFYTRHLGQLFCGFLINLLFTFFTGCFAKLAHQIIKTAKISI